MSKPVKELVTDELRSRYGELDSALWIELIGADGTTTNAFRGDLRAHEMHMQVVKNSLFRRACGQGALGPLAADLAGPAALVIGGESPIEAAKLVEGWMPKIPGLKLRGAMIEGEYFDTQRVAGLARMPTKAQLQAGIAACLRSPAANLAAAILSGGGAIAGCLKTLAEKLEKEEESPQAA
jgi:large subunit ribosomal protein L10